MMETASATIKKRGVDGLISPDASNPQSERVHTFGSAAAAADAIRSSHLIEPQSAKSAKKSKGGFFSWLKK